MNMERDTDSLVGVAARIDDSEALCGAMEAPTGPFFRRIDWSAFWTVFVLSLVLYVMTLAPTVTLEDSGELIVAADYLGVPHPPGYPIWTLASWFFQWVFHGVTFHGHPNPAWAVGLCSAFFGALACGLLAMLLSRSGAHMLQSVTRLKDVVGLRAENLFCWAGGVAGALLFAFSPAMWSQAVIAEVYSLNAFFQTLVMLLFYRWLCRPAERGTLYAMAFAFGLGLTNHQTLLLMGVALAIGLFVRDRRLFRDFFIVGAVMSLIVLVNVVGSKTGHVELLWVSGPAYASFWIQTTLAVLIPVLFAFLLPNGRTVCFTILLVELGLSFYLYMPFASDQNPPMNWGYARTWQGFIHAITRGQYERISPANIFTAKFLSQIGMYLKDLKTQFTLLVAVAGLLPFCAWRIRLRGRSWSGLYAALALGLAAAAVAAVAQFLPAGSLAQARMAELFEGVVGAILALALVGLTVMILRLLARQFLYFDAPEADLGSKIVVGVLMFLGAVVLSFVLFSILRHAFAPGVPPAAAARLWGSVLGIVLAGAGLAWLMRPPFGLSFDTHPLMQGWMLTTVVAFAAVSVGFIALANLSLDIQSQFIGRVQFIQSHAIYAIWLGYGLIFTLAFIDLALRGHTAVQYAAMAFALALPAIPLWHNAFNEEQIAILGGAEQNGHHFGWMFGHGQLQGVEGIREDLKAELSPAEFEAEWARYPDPSYPPPMSPHAIFFGGTDPGRFVPTYMIYSAKVRPDVYLITQNALADNTYINVMRDLYGDQIWIPSVLDCNYAFYQYMEDVQSGQVSAGAEVAMEGGRVSVQGVQGVMQINGILARLMFDANKRAHDFYVEESYAIPWMYPYLLPHGLILKLHRNPVALTDELIRKDRAFWDWYCKRLLDNPKFRRDVVARKSFSKLRGALAGLYVYRRRFDEAEYAFQQACALYPLSPEAYFRLADMYLQQNQFDRAIALMQEFLVKDPNNDKAETYIDGLREIRNLHGRRLLLEEEMKRGGVAPHRVLELADTYAMLGETKRFDTTLRLLLADTNVTASLYLEAAELTAAVQRYELTEECFRLYLALKPGDASIWVQRAALQAVMDPTGEKALAVLREGLRQGGEPVRDLVRSDKRFDELRTRPEFQKLFPSGSASMKVPEGLRGMFR